MKKIGLNHYSFDFDFPATQEPTWKVAVERWYQLDPYAYGLAHFYSEFKNKLGAPPSMIILASPGASNETDHAFAHPVDGKFSAAKFVHTLPSVRVSPLCQVMNWTGPTLCIQNDLNTQITAIQEAAWAAQNHSSVWVLGAAKTENGKYSVQCFILSENQGLDYEIFFTKNSTHKKNSETDQIYTDQTRTDHHLLNWLSSKTALQPIFSLGNDCDLRKRNES